MNYTLNFQKVGNSFMKDRKVKDSEGNVVTVSSRRYRYAVSGNPEALKKFREDVDNGYPGAEDHEEFGLVWYSWDPKFGDTVLLRGRQKPDEDFCRWFQDLESIDEMEAFAKRSPHMVKALGYQATRDVFTVTKTVNESTERVVEDDRLLDE